MDCPFPRAKGARDDGPSSPSMQAAVFDDAVADDTQSIRLEGRCVTVDIAFCVISVVLCCPQAQPSCALWPHLVCAHT